jgi:tetratricopeptide (TPR) repeat protein
MKSTIRIAAIILATASLGYAQDLKNTNPAQPASPDPGMVKPAQPQQADPQKPATSTDKPATPATQPNRAEAYYHFTLAHMYEDMVATTGRLEYVNRAIEEYKLAIENDPSNAYLNSQIAELYAKTGRIRDAVLEAEEIIRRDPQNLDARRLLGRIYLRSLGDMQQGVQSQDMLKKAVEQYEQIVRIDPTSVEDHLLLGRLYRISNQIEKAEKEFKTAVQLHPNSEEAVTYLAYLYNDEGDSARALQVLESVPEGQRSGKLYAALGYTYEQKKDYKKAIAAFRKAVEEDSENLDAVRGLAQNLLNDGQYEAALEQYKMVSEADPQDAQTFMHLAEIYRRNGKYDQALDALKHAQSVVSDSQEINYNIAVVYDALGRFDDAALIIQDLLNKSVKPGGNYTPPERNNRAIFIERLGNIYKEQNKTKEAVDTFRQMIPLGDENASRAYQEIIDTYRDAKQWPQATAVAEEAAKKLPNDRMLQLTLAGQEADSGKPDEAIARVKAMLKGTADDREIYIALAQMQSRLKRWKEAEESIAKAIELSPKSEDKNYAMFVAGSIYERQKKYEQAETYFRKVVQDDPRNATALNYLGYMLADRGNHLEEALGFVRRAVALDPQNGAFLDSLGWAYFKMGKMELAEENLRKAADRMASDPTVHDHLGDLYQQTGRLKQAVMQWERSLEEWRKTVPAEVEQNDVAKVQKKLETAKVKLAKESSDSH